MNYKSSGVALPIFSLPDKYGIGTIGKGAKKFIDFLAKAGFSYWSILPLVPTAFLDSPYQSFSSKALNPFFIDLEDLIDKGLLKKKDLNNIDWGDNPRKVDYGKIFVNRKKILRIAFKRFIKGQGDYQKGYTSFIRKNGYLDYACFMTLKDQYSYKAWPDYDPPYDDYSEKHFREIKHLNKDDVEFNIWTQYIFLRQWDQLTNYAHEKGIKIIGEMPMYVSYDSVEVYKHYRNFQLDNKRRMTETAGYPPDFFYKTGQVWGNPLYNFDYMKKNYYRFFRDRLNYYLKLYDIIMISSSRCILEYYSLPYGSKDGLNGTWKKGPGAGFGTVCNNYHNRLIAEDVDFESQEFSEFLDSTKLPDTKVSELAFPRGLDNPNNPLNYHYSCYSFSTTHDCDTLVSYLSSMSEADHQKAIDEIIKTCKRFGITPPQNDNRQAAQAIMEMNLASNSKVAIQSMNDILLQGSEARINTPSTKGNNWTYRITAEDFNKDLAFELSTLNIKYGSN